MADRDRTLVVYAGLTPFMNNKVCDAEYMKMFPGGTSLTLMARSLIAAGYEFMTFDRHIAQHPSRRGLLISDMASGTHPPNNLLPTLCMSLESPIVASHFYHHLPTATAPFRKVWDWPGVKPRIRDSERRFIPNAWPTTDTKRERLVPWAERRFLAMVSGNKRALQMGWPPRSLLHPRQLLRTAVQNARTLNMKLTDPWMKSEIYVERLRAIGHFARHADFDLFGSGWERAKTKPERAVNEQITKAWRGPLPYEQKLDKLATYKFYLCFENTVFPGYLTEKLFDCFFAGVIPIYLGDPDVEDRIPSSAFIDARRFASYADLDDHLRSMTAAQAAEHLEAADQFLRSDGFKPFTADYFADTAVRVINDAAADYA